MTNTAPNVTPSELAEELHTDPKTVRKFLRSTTDRENQPGRGHRWSIPGNKRNISKLRRQFDAWSQAHTRAS